MRGDRGHITAMSNAAANADLWTPEERDRCEADMAQIMKTVRTHAMNSEMRSPLD